MQDADVLDNFGSLGIRLSMHWAVQIYPRV